MKAFRITGKFQMGHLRTPFTLETVAKDAAGAKDRVFATIGSRHRANRHQIEIAKVEEISLEQATDPSLEKRLSLVK